MSIKVCFVCNWGETSASLLDRYKRQTRHGSGVWGIIEGVGDITQAEYCIVMDGGFVKSFDPKKTIYLQREPLNIKNINHSYPNILFQGTYDKFYQATVYWVKKDFETLEKNTYISKQKRLSCVTSGKKMCEGHRNRLEFITRLEKEIQIDIFGRGVGFLSQHKGEIDDKFDALNSYQYALVCENSSQFNYFTEKICDSFLSLTMPIYWGCTNIGEYFPEKSFHRIDITRYEESIAKIKDVISKPPSDENIEALYESKERVLKKYNIWPTIERIILDLKV